MVRAGTAPQINKCLIFRRRFGPLAVAAARDVVGR